MTLDCPPANVEYVTRIWFRGYFGPSDEPPNSTRLYNQISSGKMINLTARPDMSVDNSSFAMTIRRVLLEDNGYFSCSTYGLSTLQNIFFQTKVDVYSKFIFPFRTICLTFLECYLVFLFISKYH